MIAQFPTGERDFLQFKFNLERIGQTCPDFVKWLEQSIEDTIDATCGLNGDALLRQTGALRDLRAILSAVNNPPEMPDTGKATGRAIGMGAV